MIAAFVAYIINAVWIAPVLLVGALAVESWARIASAARSRLWFGCLVLAVVLPALRISQAHDPERFGLLTAETSINILQTFAVARPIALALAVAVTVVAAVAGIRVATAWLAARRLVRRSEILALAPELVAEMLRFAADAHVAVPSVRRSADIYGPATAGWRAPVVLVPPDFDKLSIDQSLATLLHETAHVIRRDFAANLVSEVLALPLTWHPAAWLMRARLRVAREMACDHLAARRMPPRRYAECLVAVARRFSAADPHGPSAAIALLGRGNFERRVEELVRPRRSRGRRGAVVALTGLAFLLGAPVLLLRVSPRLTEARDVVSSTKGVAAASPSLIPYGSQVSAPLRVAVDRTRTQMHRRHRAQEAGTAVDQLADLQRSTSAPGSTASQSESRLMRAHDEGSGTQRLPLLHSALLYLERDSLPRRLADLTLRTNVAVPVEGAPSADEVRALVPTAVQEANEPAGPLPPKACRASSPHPLVI